MQVCYTGMNDFRASWLLSEPSPDLALEIPLIVSVSGLEMCSE